MANPTYEKQGTCGSHNQTCKQLGLRVPYRRPSGGVAQGVSGQDGRARQSRAREGPSLPAPGAAPERGKSDRPKAIRPGCRGALSLSLLSLCARKEKVTRPGRAKPCPAGNAENSSEQMLQASGPTEDKAKVLRPERAANPARIKKAARKRPSFNRKNQSRCAPTC